MILALPILAVWDLEDRAIETSMLFDKFSKREEGPEELLLCGQLDKIFLVCGPEPALFENKVIIY